eukprot:TRINITY_DN688_c0_g1_i1.p1 TRINITY_DN688_c0_g1~~TRINITY_DN688_c0_g1_i1.p1  ORF type:complete len:278 (-),score=61.09 TRINITY_DN688_c0_g1_i1:173-1006(-)
MGLAWKFRCHKETVCLILGLSFTSLIAIIASGTRYWCVFGYETNSGFHNTKFEMNYGAAVYREKTSSDLGEMNLAHEYEYIKEKKGDAYNNILVHTYLIWGLMGIGIVGNLLGVYAVLMDEKAILERARIAFLCLVVGCVSMNLCWMVSAGLVPSKDDVLDVIHKRLRIFGLACDENGLTCSAFSTVGYSWGLCFSAGVVLAGLTVYHMYFRFVVLPRERKMMRNADEEKADEEKADEEKADEEKADEEKADEEKVVEKETNIEMESFPLDKETVEE